MPEELPPQHNIPQDAERTEGNVSVPLRDVFGKLSETPPSEDPAFWPVKVLNEGIRLTRDSWETTIVTENARKSCTLAVLDLRA